MNIRKIALIAFLIFVTATVAFASAKEGYYHNNQRECIAIMDTGNGNYMIVWYDRAGRLDFRANARLHGGNRLLYQIGGSNHYIELKNNRNIIYCTRTRSDFTWSYGLGH